MSHVFDSTYQSYDLEYEPFYSEFDRSAGAPVLLHYYPAPAGAEAEAESIPKILFLAEAQELLFIQELLAVTEAFWYIEPTSNLDFAISEEFAPCSV